MLRSPYALCMNDGKLCLSAAYIRQPSGLPEVPKHDHILLSFDEQPHDSQCGVPTRRAHDTHERHAGMIPKF